MAPHPKMTTAQHLAGATRLAINLGKDYQAWCGKHSGWEKQPGLFHEQKVSKSRLDEQTDRLHRLIRQVNREGARQRNEERHERHEQRREERYERHEQRRAERQESRSQRHAERDQLRLLVAGLSRDIDPIPAPQVLSERSVEWERTDSATAFVLATIAPTELSREVSPEPRMPWEDEPAEHKQASPAWNAVRPAKPAESAADLIGRHRARQTLQELPSNAALEQSVGSIASVSTPLQAGSPLAPRIPLTPSRPPPLPPAQKSPVVDAIPIADRKSVSADPYGRVPGAPAAPVVPSALQRSALSVAVDRAGYGRVPMVFAAEAQATSSINTPAAPVDTKVVKPISIYSSIHPFYKKEGKGGLNDEQRRAFIEEVESQRRMMEQARKIEAKVAKGYHPDYGEFPTVLTTTRADVQRDNKVPSTVNYGVVPEAPANASGHASDYDKVSSVHQAQEAKAQEGTRNDAVGTSAQQGDPLTRASRAASPAAPTKPVTFVQPSIHTEYGVFINIRPPEPHNASAEFNPAAYASTGPARSPEVAPATEDYFGKISNPGYEDIPRMDSDGQSVWSVMGEPSSGDAEAVYDEVRGRPQDEIPAGDDNDITIPVTDAEAAEAVERAERRGSGQYDGDYGMLPEDGDPAPVAVSTSSASSGRMRANAVTSADRETNYAAMPSQASSSNSSAESVGVRRNDSPQMWGSRKSSRVEEIRITTQKDPEETQANTSVATKIRNLLRSFISKSDVLKKPDNVGPNQGPSNSGS